MRFFVAPSALANTAIPSPRASHVAEPEAKVISLLKTNSLNASSEREARRQCSEEPLSLVSQVAASKCV